MTGFMAVAVAIFTSCTSEPVSVSPDEGIRLYACVDADGVPSYGVSAWGSEVLSMSSLGIDAEEADLAGGFIIDRVKKSRHDEVWTQPWGENKTVRDRHNEMAVMMHNHDGVKLTLRFRLFDDGIGFRYEYETVLDSLTITAENTRFNFASDGMSWSIPGNFETYELDTREMPVSEVETANTPFTFKAGEIYGSIHEAALYDYPEMNLYSCGDLAFRSELAPRPDGYKARVPGVFKTPWRTLQLSREAVGLINSSLILNLNAPCAIEDVSWIAPQKYVGVWWGMHLGTHSWTCGSRHGATTENALRHIDFAAENNIDGVLFEGWNKGWETWGGRQHFDYCGAYPDFDIEKINKLPRVDIIYSHVNADRVLVDAAVAAGAKGIVAAGTGNGSISEREEAGLVDAMKKGVTVVRSARVQNGPTTASVARWQEEGILFSQALNPQKARMLLQLALTKTQDPKKIQEYFDKY